MYLTVLHPFEFFAARDDSAVTLAPKGRQILAQCVSTGNSVKDRQPRDGAEELETSASFARASKRVFWLRLRRSVGQPILAAAGFQPALAWCDDSRLAGKSRLKGGCGQDCPPRNTLAGAHHQRPPGWDRHPCLSFSSAPAICAANSAAAALLWKIWTPAAPSTAATRLRSCGSCGVPVMEQTKVTRPGAAAITGASSPAGSGLAP